MTFCSRANAPSWLACGYKRDEAEAAGMSACSKVCRDGVADQSPGDWTGSCRSGAVREHCVNGSVAAAGEMQVVCTVTQGNPGWVLMHLLVDAKFACQVTPQGNPTYT